MKLKGKKTFAILILAAGNSSRLGHPKQLVSIQGKSLLSNTLSEAQKVADSDIFIVTGAYVKELNESIYLKPFEVIYNEDWAKGMGGSISKGINSIMEYNYEGVLISVCDQPYIEKENFDNLISKYQKTGKSIVVSSYAEGSGPPVFFQQKYFKELSILDGDLGAKVIIRKYKNNVDFVVFEKGNIDIDTERDISQLNKSL